MPKGFRADADWLQKHGYQLGDGPGGVVPVTPPQGKTLVEIFAPLPQPARTRQKMNQVEQRWFEVLKVRHPPLDHITPQFRLRVSAFGEEPVHYTADFLVAIESIVRGCWTFVLWEVKDARRKPHSDELVRAKTVRLQNPWISAVYLAVWDGQNWSERAL